ncbi:MAG TPA: DUF4433 domain-containing protein [Terricaulis sp.]|nr:DUF4433 domain-containing protein [Terricaulis sp.]
MAPSPTHIFHITAIQNLVGIWQTQAIKCKKLLDATGKSYQSIAYDDLQDRRARRIVRKGETLHDFVPFMFAPRSPMLKAIDSGLVKGYVGGQRGVAHLVSTAQRVRDAALDFLFTDYHAIVAYAKFYSNLTDLDKIDWPLFFEDPLLDGYCKWWHSRASPTKYIKRSETRQAELLVRDKFPVGLIRGIAVADDETAARVGHSLATLGWNIPVKAKPNWYY